MARDEIAGRLKRGGANADIPTGEEMTEERVRDGESATGRAGGTGRTVRPEEEDVPRKTPGGPHTNDKAREAGDV
jgi:hypothetical protein